MDIHQALSPKLIGATYALLRGDLVTAYKLGQESIHDEPFDKEAYLLLTYACSSLDLWQDTAEYARVAFCLGVEDERLLALLSGLYQAIDMEREANWLIQTFGVDAFDVSQVLSNEERAHLKDLLPRPPRMPKKNHRPQGDFEEVNDYPQRWKPFPISSPPHSLPSWLEVSETVNMMEGPTKRPDWITEETDGLDTIFRLPIRRVDWIEDNEQDMDRSPFGAIGSSNLDVSSIPNVEVQTESTNTSSAEDAPINELNHEAYIRSAEEQAKLLGLGHDFTIAIELAELSLTQEAGKTKKLFGPLILALSGSQLMIVAYEGDMLRQKPWAFTSDQLNQTTSQENTITLTVQGNRSISFQVETKEQAQYLVQNLSQWH